MTDIFSRPFTDAELATITAMKAVTYNETRASRPEFAEIPADGIDDDLDHLTVHNGEIVDAPAKTVEPNRRRDVYRLVGVILLWIAVCTAAIGLVAQAVQS